MRLCIVSTYYYPSIGGIERYLKDLTDKLIEQNIVVHVVTASFDGQQTEEKNGSLTVHRIPFMNPLDEENKVENGKKFLKFMEELIKKHKIDLISAQNFHRVGKVPSFALALNLVSMNLNKPLTLRVHSFSTKELDDCFLRDLNWDKVVCVSNSVKEDAYSKGVKIDNIVTIYPGVEINKFKPDKTLSIRKNLKISDEDIVILWAGRICNSQKPILDEKGLLTLLKALSVISPRYKNIKLLVAAAEPVAPLKPLFEGTIEQILELAKLYNISNKVIVKTFSLEEMPAAYNTADMFVMPSQMETFGLVYAEALACGIPVIGTAVGGVPEIIDNEKNGFIIPPDNSIELSHKIEFLINNPEKRKEFGAEGRKKVSIKFALNAVTSKLLGVYNSVVYKKKNGPDDVVSFLIKKFKDNSE